MTSDKIISLLPYQDPFLFVDGISEMTEDGIVGHYTFRPDASFYKGHFKNNPITPGVIITECMAQIGLVCFGINLLKDQVNRESPPKIALTASQIDFFIPVLPGERVKVVSQKEVFRFGKLKCKVQMYNEKEELVCRGLISGMMEV
ncbi:MAG: hydroxymyristoyl-ACP dehydratase [Psychroserpens sp.]|nr:hydroxymyristoyl-ACP dehydratase [Psychroserpens sp.]